MDAVLSEPTAQTTHRPLLRIENLKTHEFELVAYDGSGIYAECRFPQDIQPPCGHSESVSDHDAVSRWFQRGLVLAGALSVPLFVMFQNAQPILALLRQPADSVPLAAS